MFKSNFSRALFFTLLFVVTAGSACAENMKKLGAMDVHYMALSATFLTPEVAKAYGIERSRYNGLINISVLDNSKANKPAKNVAIIATAKNNLGQIKRLDFEEVQEGDAIYYLAQIRFRDQEEFEFEVEITDGTTTERLTFKQKFYAE
ncbi:DUF4426 domain-containing protein [Endozoicomonas sp. G2_1]|uniref:DUF4426 domain-containing protein n=1 Tax=Endozoicomonas sp. G2_1 TaxID=2821091 RepID=UPI001ADAC4A7|nr:DUF4426 domain-containing protein [Endozoicomonas sp. G2_1]MBO9489139.1 DUF4426 domain-containing protein [Endozoicomonas sp. G2_1]